MIIHTRFPLSSKQYDFAQKKNTDKLKDIMKKLTIKEDSHTPEFTNQTGKGFPVHRRELPVIYTNNRSKKPKTFAL